MVDWRMGKKKSNTDNRTIGDNIINWRGGGGRKIREINEVL
jgi:hypothetical protein